MNTFGDLLRRLRLDAGFSQESLAEHAGVSAKAIGAYERGLRFFPRRETIAQLVEALKLTGEVRATFENTARRKLGAAQSAQSQPDHNLPWQPTSFVGRHRELREIADALTNRGLVTLTGSGGMGKTRIALEVASRLALSDGVWFVDLASLTEVDLVLSKVASVLDPRPLEQGDSLNALVAALKSRELLIILDNCEHVLSAARSVAAAILQACPGVSILATSRERLAVAGERTYQVLALPLPTKAIGSAAEALPFDSLRLFAERASAAQHGFSLTDENVATVAAICRQLDGNPLAIELVAARLAILGLSELQSQLAEHFRVIVRGHRSLPARQQTLHATITWSHDLLDETERTVFRRLAVFANGWTVEAATTVCSDDAVEKASVLEALLSLVEKSLVIVDLELTASRYSFVESTRAYALERLVDAAELQDYSRRQAEWIATFSDRVYDTFLVTPRGRWELSVEPERDNALAALEWAIGVDGDALLAARIASALYGFWTAAGLAAYGRRYVDTALDRIDARSHPVLAARLLLAQSQYLHGTTNAEAIRRAISLVEHSNDRLTLARCYAFLSYTLARRGEYSAAENASDRAKVLLDGEGLQRTPLYSRFLSDRSLVLRELGRADEADRTLAEAMSLATVLGDDWIGSLCQTILAEIAFASDDIQRAIALGEEALLRARQVRQEMYALCNLACFQLASGDIDVAELHVREAIDLAGTSNPQVLSGSVQHLAMAAALRGKPLRAARLIGYVNAWYDRIGSLRDPTDQKGYDILMASLRAQLSGDEIAALAAQGALLSADGVLSEALHG